MALAASLKLVSCRFALTTAERFCPMRRISLGPSSRTIFATDER